MPRRALGTLFASLLCLAELLDSAGKQNALEQLVVSRVTR